MYEMNKMVEGVELDDNVEVISQQELEAEGDDFDQSQEEQKDTDSDASQLTFAMQHRQMAEKVSDASTFQSYMIQVYGEDIFQTGFEIVKNYRQHIFSPDGVVALHQELSQIIDAEQVRKDFIQVCLTHLIYV